MLRWTARLLLVVVVSATGWLVLDRMVLSPRERARIREEAAELAKLVRAEVEAFNSRVFVRDPLPGEPASGDALEHYREALRLMDASGVDRDLLYHFDLGDPGAKEVLTALAPVFEAAAAGTRARSVSVFLPVRAPGEKTDLGPAVRLTELLLFDAALDFEGGRPADGLAFVETALRMGRDLTAARPWAAERRIFCERAIEVLGKAVGQRRLGPAERARAIEVLKEDLSFRAPAWEAFRAPCLEIQVLLAAYFEGRVPFEKLGVEFQLPPREARYFGLVRDGPTDRELLAGWRRLRDFLPEFEAEAGARPTVFATWATNRIGEYRETEPPAFEFAVVAPGLVWGTVALWGKGKKHAEEQAVLIALRLLDEEGRAGVFPTALAGTVDPEAEPILPGAEWVLRESDLGKPALYCELPGETDLARGSRFYPVFRFR